MSGEKRQPVPGLRSPRVEVKGLAYFGRMVDKIRLGIAGKLPKDYQENLGQSFDKSCCDFLGVSYPALQGRVRQGGTDEEILGWCENEGGKRRAQEDFQVWSVALSKKGLRDDLTDRLNFRKKEAGWEDRDEIQSFFDYIDADEGRL